MHKHTATVCQNADISRSFCLTFYKNLGLIKPKVEHLSLRKPLLWLHVTNNTLLFFSNNRKPCDTATYKMVENWISGTKAQLNHYNHLDEMRKIRSNERQANTFYTFSRYIDCSWYCKRYWFS